MKPRICLLKEEEIPALANLEAQIFADAWSEKSLRDSYLQDRCRIWTAWEGEELLAYLIFLTAADEGEVARIAVASACRGQGIAGMLMNTMKSFCVGMGIVTVFLEVRESNQAAIGLYQSQGFSKDGIRKNYYQDPVEHALLMSLKLGGNIC